MNTIEGETRFASALEECCRRVRDGENLDRCLADYPGEYRQELARLVPVSGNLRRLHSDPSPGFQARLERQLLDSADKLREQARRSPFKVVAGFFAAAPRRVAVLALVALVIVAGSGVGVVRAAENSLPDEPLYQVKTVREWVEIALARDGATRMGVHLRIIVKRGRELERAVKAGKPRRVVEALSLRLANSTQSLVDLAIEASNRGERRSAAAALTGLRAVQRQLDSLVVEADPSILPALQRLGQGINAQEQRLRSAIVGGPRNAPAARP